LGDDEEDLYHKAAFVCSKSGREEFMNGKKLLIIGVAVIAVVLAGAFYYIKGTPQYSLYMLKKAIEQNDSEGAMKYLDVDSIVDTAMVNVMKDVSKKSETFSDNDFEAAGAALGAGLFMMMKPAIKDALSAGIKQAISDPEKDKTGLGNIFGTVDIKVNGKSATIIPDGAPDTSFRMAKTSEGYWRITEISNLEPPPPGAPL
jgi:hypothetical protein